MQLPNLHTSLSSAYSAHGVYQSVSLFPRIFAYDVDLELSKLTTAFLDTDGVGYSQENFKAACRCGFHITMDYLGVYKFVKNIFEQNPPASYLAHVFYLIPSQTLSFIEFMYSSFLLLSPLHFDITEGRCTRPTTRTIPRVLRR